MVTSLCNLCSEGNRAGVSVSGPAAASATNLPAGPTPAAAAGDPSLPPLPPAWRKLLLEGYQIVNENPVRALLSSSKRRHLCEQRRFT